MKPNLNAEFRPKADRELLLRLNEAAWKKVSDAIYEKHVATLGDELASHLESLFPLDDMLVLEKYGCASHVDQVHVRVRVPDSESWNESVTIPLTRKPLVPTGRASLYCGGERFSQRYDRGVNPPYRAEMEASGKWEAFVQDQDRREREMVPEHLEKFLFDMVSARREYRKDYNRLWEWPGKYRQENGSYPTWTTIAAEFPVAGGEIHEHFTPTRQ